MTDKPLPVEASAEAEVPSILLLSGDAREARDMRDLLQRSGWDCTTAGSAREGLALLQRRSFDVVLTETKLPDSDGVEIVRRARQAWPDTEVVLIAETDAIPAAVRGIQEGADNYLTKPLNLTELRAIVARSLQHHATVKDNLNLHRALEERFGFEGIVAGSAVMRQVLETVKQIAPTTATVLVLGESGTGKELIARSIHLNSARKSKPFVALNCAALSASVLESELFGHERGAFTGALHLRKGRFEYAHGGTLFLDEVGDMPMELQVKLLRVIEEREIVRVGSNVPIPVDVRLVAATNKDLARRVAEGRFREDLYFRLNVVMLRLPPLRERKEELSLFVERFIPEFAKGFRKKVTGMSPQARKVLFAHAWPGNVRELKNTVESMVAVTRDEVLDVDDLPDYLLAGAGGVRKPEPLPGPRRPLEIVAGMTAEEAERALVRVTLEATGGNRRKAAKMLKMGERTLYRKIRQYGLE